MDTPVAFLIFNRPDCTRRVFAAIRQARPRRLLVVADGPREDRPNEAERCEETRTIITQGIDWPCELETRYSPQNLGCRLRVSSGLDWVFSQVEEAIVLEDDCLPHPSFFSFCETLLNVYREDERIMVIAGAGMDRLRSTAPPSYRFSRLCHIWGWASWRRAWKHYDLEMRLWPEFRDSHRLHDLFPAPRMRQHLASLFELAHGNRVDTWDYQLNFASFVQNGLNIVPRRNLITNIGYTADATHTTNPHDLHANLPSEEMPFPLVHPQIILADNAADQRVALPHRSLPLWKRMVIKGVRYLPWRRLPISATTNSFL